MDEFSIVETLDRSKRLDDAVLHAIWGLQHCREGMSITGVTRLELAREKLDIVIDLINKDLEEGVINGDNGHY